MKGRSIIRRSLALLLAASIVLSIPFTASAQPVEEAGEVQIAAEDGVAEAERGPDMEEG